MVVTCSKCGKSRQELEIESFKTVERSHLVTICFDCIDGLKATIIERMKKELHRFIKDVDDSPLPPDPDDIIIPDFDDKSHPEGLIQDNNPVKGLINSIDEIKKSNQILQETNLYIETNTREYILALEDLISRITNKPFDDQLGFQGEKRALMALRIHCGIDLSKDD